MTNEERDNLMINPEVSKEPNPNLEFFGVRSKVEIHSQSIDGKGVAMTGNNLKQLSAAMKESLDSLRQAMLKADCMVQVHLIVDFKHRGIEETLTKVALFHSKQDDVLQELEKFFSERCFARTPDNFEKFLDMCKAESQTGGKK